MEIHGDPGGTDLPRQLTNRQAIVKLLDEDHQGLVEDHQGSMGLGG